MATKTINWNDGSGGKIYLTYASATGNQTVAVSSDANTGAARAMTVYFSTGNISRQLVVEQEAGVVEPYIVFADPVVEQICATNWGDGVGITPSQAAAVTSIGYTFRGNTSIVSFEEFGTYFTGVTQLDGTASSPYGAFAGCTALTRLTLPTSLTKINAAAFRGDTALKTLTIPSSVTSVGSSAFTKCTGLKDFYFLSTLTWTGSWTGTQANGMGDGTGTFSVAGAYSTNSNYAYHFKRFIVAGNFTKANPPIVSGTSSGQTIQEVRIGGNVTATPNSLANGRLFSGPTGSAASALLFLEIGGTITTTYCIVGSGNAAAIASGFILHLGYDTAANNALPCTPTIAGADLSGVTKIYVGPGLSQAGDQAILNKYLADSAWSAYASKLDLWYNYNGDYKQ